MGEYMSVPEKDCVSIREFAWLMEETYTVERTSGKKDDGWFIPKNPHICAAGCPSWLDARASNRAVKNPGVWRIFMRNSEEDPTLHSCGWRRITTVVPTRLLGNEQATEEWRDRVIKLLDSLSP